VFSIFKWIFDPFPFYTANNLTSYIEKSSSVCYPVMTWIYLGLLFLFYIHTKSLLIYGNILYIIWSKYRAKGITYRWMYVGKKYYIFLKPGRFFGAKGAIHYLGQSYSYYPYPFTIQSYTPAHIGNSSFRSVDCMFYVKWGK